MWEEESAPFLKQTDWADTFYNLNAIHKTTCACGANKTSLSSKTLIEILSISCFMLILVTTDGCHFGISNCKKKNIYF